MKIYSVIEYGGEWEDYAEYVQGIFPSKEEAEKLCDYLSEIEADRVARHQTCVECICGCGENNRCSNFKSDWDGDCLNYYSHYDEIFYRIDENVVNNTFDEWKGKEWKERF